MMYAARLDTVRCSSAARSLSAAATLAGRITWMRVPCAMLGWWYDTGKGGGNRTPFSPHPNAIGGLLPICPVAQQAPATPGFRRPHLPRLRHYTAAARRAWMASPGGASPQCRTPGLPLPVFWQRAAFRPSDALLQLPRRHYQLSPPPTVQARSPQASRDRHDSRAVLNDPISQPKTQCPTFPR